MKYLGIRGILNNTSTILPPRIATKMVLDVKVTVCNAYVLPRIRSYSLTSSLTPLKQILNKDDKPTQKLFGKN